MLLRAPRGGIVHILPNNRAQGSFGTARPPFQEGDTVWTGAAIAEIPDLESLRVEFRVDEVDRGRVEEGQETRIRIDAVPDALLSGAVSWLSPIATLVFNRLPPEKNFPAHSGIDDIDDRLRPGMSATVEIVVQRISDVLVIPQQGLDADRRQADGLRQGRTGLPKEAHRGLGHERNGNRRGVGPRGGRRDRAGESRAGRSRQNTMTPTEPKP